MIKAWVVSSQRRLSASSAVEFAAAFEEERVEDESRAREDEVKEGVEKMTLRYALRVLRRVEGPLSWSGSRFERPGAGQGSRIALEFDFAVPGVS